MVSRRQRRRQRRLQRKVEAGDGHRLKRYRFWQLLSRSLFHLDSHDEDREPCRWSVNVGLWGDSDGEVRASLYRAGVHEARAKLPAAFAVPAGVIEVQASSFGLSRCHLVRPDGSDQVLTPDPASAEGRRARLARRRPGVSAAIGAVSFVVLLVALVLGVPQIVQQISEIPWVADNLGVFTSPFALPAWLNISLLVATILASSERALRLRQHWLLDGGLFEGET